MNQIKKIAQVLSHKGPDLFDLISESKKNKKAYDINFDVKSKTTSVTIFGKEAYALNVEDTYIFNNKHELIRQIVKLDGKPKIVFDKFKSARKMIHDMILNEDTKITTTISN